MDEDLCGIPYPKFQNLKRVGVLVDDSAVAMSSEIFGLIDPDAEECIDDDENLEALLNARSL
jgi:hypothetical protein